ncbi:1-deoxy-D-xylulose 5-phosphate reductoisomerase [bacterium HR37]|nr:1-deoxy-D-xylulose 5-phosphate reductoisomerase [bacterium HR37]
MKRISILGSTGSIGRQTLEVISQFPDRFRVVGLAAGRNIGLLKEQIIAFRPEVVSLKNKEDANLLSKELSTGKVKVLWGEDGAEAVAAYPEADIVVSAMVGASGLKPTLCAVKSGKNVALANKETLVMAGSILTEEAFKNRVNILPVDSEHSAIFQALGNNKREFIKRLILTASGGPLLKLSEDQLNNVTIEMALNHPTWKMGKKISIDSATLMNKGFEVIEAKWLFGVPPDKISVWIHPQSIVHSMVEYIDGSIIAQMSIPDMRIPIAYALSYPERIPLNLNRETSISSFKELTFEEASFSRFPALKLAYKAAEEGGTVPAVMNAANEIAVEAFLQGKIRFTDIIRIVSKVMELHRPLPGNTLEEILEMDSWARKTAKALIS